MSLVPQSFTANAFEQVEDGTEIDGGLSQSRLPNFVLLDFLTVWLP